MENLINKEIVAKRARNNMLNGAYIEEYIYKYDENRIIDGASTKYYNIDNSNNREVEITRDKTDHEDSMFTNRELPIHFNYTISNNCYEKNGAEVRIYLLPDEYRSIPFRECSDDISKDDKPRTITIGNVTKILPDEKSECSVLCIDTESMYDIVDKNNSNKNCTVTKEYHFKSSHKIAINNDAYIYIIIMTDGTLPIIITSDKKIPIYDVNEYIYGNPMNIIDDKKIFTNYFEPHYYSETEKKIFNNAVFGAPGKDIESRLNYSESYDSGEYNEYNNSDGIKVITSNDHHREVYFEGLNIAHYGKDEDIDIENFDIYKFYTEEVGNQEELDEDIDEDILLLLENKEEEIYSKIAEECLNMNYSMFTTTMRKYNVEFYSLRNSIYISGSDESGEKVRGIIHRYSDNDYVEMLMIASNSFYYLIYVPGTNKVFCLTKDRFKDLTITKTRSIHNIHNNKDKSLIIYFNNNDLRPGHLSYAKNTVLCSTNVPELEGLDLNYNIFGVPEDL